MMMRFYSCEFVLILLREKHIIDYFVFSYFDRREKNVCELYYHFCFVKIHIH